MEKKDYNSIINKMNRETKEKLIKWERSNQIPDSINEDEKLIGNVFISEISQKKLRIYKYEWHRYLKDDFGEIYDEIGNGTSTRLEFIDEKNTHGWEFPYDFAMESLYDSILFIDSNVEDFLSEYVDK